MPSEKQFEYMTLEFPPQIKKMNMYEMLENQTKLVKNLFDMIEENKGDKYYFATIEVPNDDTNYGIRKRKENFIIHNPTTGENNVYAPIDFFNWCMAKAPYMSFVGRASHGERADDIFK